MLNVVTNSKKDARENQSCSQKTKDAHEDRSCFQFDFQTHHKSFEAVIIINKIPILSRTK